MKKIGHGPLQNMGGNLKMQDNGANGGGGHGHLGHVTTIALAGPARA